MKKEKILNTKEKNRKKFRMLKKVMDFSESLLLAMPIVIIVIFGLGVVLTAQDANVENTEKIDIMAEMRVFTKTEDIVENEKVNDVLTIGKFIIYIIGYIMNILIIDNLKRIFENIEKNDTPFTEDNVKHLNVISELAVLGFITRFMGNSIGMSIVPLVIILAITTVFKYGCELQKEVDETL